MTYTRSFCFLIISLLSVTHMACGQAVTGHTTTKTRADSRDVEFIRKAGEANMAQMGFGDLITKKAQNPQLRDFAQQMRREHEQSDQQLQELAQSHGVSWPVPVSKHDAAILEKADNLSGDKFDRTVLDRWITDQKDKIKDFEREAKHAQDPQLKQYAISSLPTLREQLNRAQTLAGTPVIREAAGAEKQKTARENRAK
jgi:putative membrane protein